MLVGVVDDVDKCSESVWKTCFYSTSLAWGLYLSAARSWSWWYSTDACFDHVPALYAAPDSLDTDIYMFYVFQLGFYSHSIFAHVFQETHRSDFVEMLVHHVATLALILCSFSVRLVAGGTLIVIVHDIADVIFEAAKQLIYRKREFEANIAFGLWVLSWIVTRLVYFPLYIIHGVVWVSISKLGYYPMYGLLSTFLLVLLVLHAFWTIMIFKMIYRMLTGEATKIRDTREDKPKTKKK
jgi:hypothetical protein